MSREGGWGSRSPSKETCRRCAARVPWLAFVGNMILTVYKVAIGYLGSSPALMADGLHSFTDVIGTGVIIASTRVSSREPDSKNPYGYGKVEFMSSMFIYVVLIGLAIFIFGGGLMLIVTGTYHRPHLVTFFGGLVSVIYNVVMYRMGQCAGKRTNSPALLANSFENRADAISSVAVCIGILLAITIHPAADSLAAMIVGVIILVNCIHEGKKAVAGLMDHGPSTAVVQKIRNVAASQASVSGVSFVKVRPTGTGYWMDIGIQVDPGTSVSDADSVANRVRDVLLSQSGQLDAVHVYVEPHFD